MQTRTLDQLIAASPRNLAYISDYCRQHPAYLADVRNHVIPGLRHAIAEHGPVLTLIVPGYDGIETIDYATQLVEWEAISLAIGCPDCGAPNADETHCLFD